MRGSDLRGPCAQDDHVRVSFCSGTQNSLGNVAEFQQRFGRILQLGILRNQFSQPMQTLLDRSWLASQPCVMFNDMHQGEPCAELLGKGNRITCRQCCIVGEVRCENYLSQFQLWWSQITSASGKLRQLCPS